LDQGATVGSRRDRGILRPRSWSAGKSGANEILNAGVDAEIWLVGRALERDPSLCV